ncbi:alpha-N-acetylgalactosaminide alpha-2,6-sialyltransferase 3 isoform 4-T4 [Sarcophilus harrisii]
MWSWDSEERLWQEMGMWESREKGTTTRGAHEVTPREAEQWKRQRPSPQSRTALRKPVIALGLLAAFLFLLAARLFPDVDLPQVLSCLGQSGARWLPFSAHRRPLRTHYGYVHVKTQEPLQLDCDLCAIVSSSGQMVGQKVGAEIDGSSCVWRMNNAPTRGYEEDVGRKTSVRVVSHTSVPLLLKNPDYFFKETNSTVYVIWGPFRNMRRDGNGIVYNMLRKAVDVYPGARIYVTTEKRMAHCDGVFKKETGKDRLQPEKYPPCSATCAECSHLGRIVCELKMEAVVVAGPVAHLIIVPGDPGSPASLSLLSMKRTKVGENLPKSIKMLFGKCNFLLLILLVSFFITWAVVLRFILTKVADAG